jgi:outer membrane protein OmpA-like peptidoglycan-associated protein
MWLVKKAGIVLSVMLGTISLFGQVYEAHPMGIKLQYGVINYNESSYTSIIDQYNIPLATGLVFSVYPGKNTAFDIGIKHYCSPMDNGTRLSVWSGQGLIKLTSRKISRVYKLNRFQPYIGIGAGYEYLSTRGGEDSIPRNSFHQFFMPVEAGLDINLSPRWSLGVFGEYRIAPFQKERNEINGYDKFSSMVNTAGVSLSYYFGKTRRTYAAPPVYLRNNILPGKQADTPAVVLPVIVPGTAVPSQPPSPIVEREYKRSSDTVMVIVKVITGPETHAIVASEGIIQKGGEIYSREDTLSSRQPKDTIGAIADTLTDSAIILTDSIVLTPVIKSESSSSRGIVHSDTTGEHDAHVDSTQLTPVKDTFRLTDSAETRIDTVAVLIQDTLALQQRLTDTLSIPVTMQGDTSVSPIQPNEVVGKSFGISLPADDKEIRATSTDLQYYMDSLRMASRVALAKQPVIHDTIVVVKAVKDTSVMGIVYRDSVITRKDTSLTPVVQSKEITGRSFGISVPDGNTGAVADRALQQYMDSLRNASRLALSKQPIVRDTLVVVKEVPVPVQEVKKMPETVRTDTVFVREIVPAPAISTETLRVTPVAPPVTLQDKYLLQERDSLIFLLNEYRSRSVQYTIPPATGQQYTSPSATGQQYTVPDNTAQQQMQATRVSELENYVRQLERRMSEMTYQLNQVSQQPGLPAQPATQGVFVPVPVAPPVKDIQEVPAVPRVDTVYIRDTIVREPVIKDTVTMKPGADAEALVIARVDSAMKSLNNRLDALTASLAAREEPKPAPAVIEKPVEMPFSRQQLTVYFAINSSTLSTSDRARIRDAIAAHPWAANEFVVLSGYTDPSGSAAYNLVLSQKRVAAVKTVLLQAGVQPGQISEQIFGDSKSGGAPPEDERRVIVEFITR